MSTASTFNERRPVPGYEGRYEVTTQGEVISLLGRNPLVLTTYLSTNGHYTVSLRKDGCTRKYKVSVLVLTAFDGPRPDGDIHAAHVNGDKTDNRLSNLSWKTRVENEADKVRHGTSNRGERQGRSKLTWEKVRTIRQRAGSEAQRALAAEFGVHQQTISAIVAGRTWKEAA